MSDIKEVVKRRRFKAGYEIREEVVDGSGYGCLDFIMKTAYTVPNGDYLGDPKTAYFLCKKHGIKPEKISPDHKVCSIGFCEQSGKYYGWSHRAMYGFSIGDTVKEGDVTAEYLPIGFTAKDLDDCKKMAIAFAKSVS